MEAIKRADAAIVLWLNQWVGHFPPLDALVKITVSDYFVPMVLSLILLFMWFGGRDAQERDKYQRSAGRAMIALGLVNIAMLIVNLFVFRPRPFAEHDLALLFYQPTDSSFPAHPAALGFAVASGVWQGSHRLGKVCYGLAILWSASRVYAGVFYPTDIIGGALIGLGVSFLVALALRVLEPLPTLILRGARAIHLA